MLFSVAGGIVTERDLKDYTVEISENPLRYQLGDYTLISPKAPLSGPVLGLILNILKGETFLKKVLCSSFLSVAAPAN